MPLIKFNLDTGKLDVGLGVNSDFLSELRMPVGSTQQIKIGFYRPSGDTTGFLDIGSDPQIEFIVKEATGADRFDDAPVCASPVFTRDTVNDVGDYFYSGELDLSAPYILKRLGVDNGYAFDSMEIVCLDCSQARLSGKYLDIYTSATAYTRFWFNVTGQGSVAPTAGTGGTLYQITIANNATAAAVATALETGLDTLAYGSAIVASDTITFSFSVYGFRGISNNGTTGFAFTLITAGMSAAGTTDVEEYAFSAQIKYTATGPQVSDMFSLLVENSLYRSGQTYPDGSSAAFYRQGTVICSTSETVTVTFSSALPSADYHIIELIVRHTAGTPAYTLAACTIDDKSTTGFVVYLNGNATTDYTLDYKVTL